MYILYGVLITLIIQNMTTMMALTTLFSSHTYTHTLSLILSCTQLPPRQPHVGRRYAREYRRPGYRNTMRASGIYPCDNTRCIVNIPSKTWLVCLSCPGQFVMTDTVLCVVHEEDSKRFDTTTFLRVISMELNIRFHGRPALATDL